MQTKVLAILILMSLIASADSTARRVPLAENSSWSVMVPQAWGAKVRSADLVLKWKEQSLINLEPMELAEDSLEDYLLYRRQHQSEVRFSPIKSLRVGDCQVAYQTVVFDDGQGIVEIVVSRGTEGVLVRALNADDSDIPELLKLVETVKWERVVQGSDR